MAARRRDMPEELPWLRHYGAVAHHLDYPAVTLHEALATTAARVPDAVAWDFLGTRRTYRAFMDDIARCADALAACGLREGDRMLVSAPTTPQGVIAFYAANRVGAVPAMIHPLSTSAEIARYLDLTGARIALTFDAFFPALASAAAGKPLERIIVARFSDFLSPVKRAAFWLAKGRRIPRVPDDPRVRGWSRLMGASHPRSEPPARRTDDPAAILFSGGTSGEPKAVVLSNRNLIAQGMQAAAWVALSTGDSMVAALPIFHGFGLAVCVNAVFMAGGRSILVPVFEPAAIARVVRRLHPNFLVGVPTLYDALSKDRDLARADLSCLEACFCGADTLPRPVRERFEAMVRAAGGRPRLLEGYGLTEAVSGVIATPLDGYREGSIGVPLPDMRAAICRPGTTEVAGVGDEGEICVSGPAVMTGYLGDPAATAEALRVHADGRTWLHTGDLGREDADGYFYFTVRLKRMIKTSGFNVYPAQVEAVLAAHPLVSEVCVIGVPDAARVERVKACVVLKDPSRAGEAAAQALMAHCRERLIRWSCPREVEFRRELPHTRVGKVDYRALMREERPAAAQGGRR